MESPAEDESDYTGLLKANGMGSLLLPLRPFDNLAKARLNLFV